MAKKAVVKHRKVADHGPTEAEALPAHAEGTAEASVDSEETDHGTVAGDSEEVSAVKAEIEASKVHLKQLREQLRVLLSEQ